MKYFFPIHLDGDNRGCEGIAKGTAILLDEPKRNLIGLCSNINLDKRLGLDKYITLKPYRRVPIIKRAIRKVCHIAHIPCPISIPVHYSFDHFVSQFTSADVLVMTGGDMMCYGNNQINSTIEIAYNKGCKSILWGCSMGPENLTPQKEDALRKFSLIYARESLSYEFLKSLGLKNVVCFPDPAFVLEPEVCELPDVFNGNKVVGLNISNFVVESDNLDTQFGTEIKRLVAYIINETDYHILLIPHVMWNDQDDRLLSQAILEMFPNNTDRLRTLQSSNLNYLQIRHIISRCDMFIGARTHAVISAYSTCVPTLALGYSIKSKGIAKDLGLSDSLVVDSKNMKHEGYLLEAFKILQTRKSLIKQHLQDVVPNYKAKSYDIKQIVNEFCSYMIQ